MSGEYDPNFVYKPTLAIVGQKVVVENEKGEILFLRRSEKCSRAGGWDFPGGGLEKGEVPYESIRRETKEESGLDLENLELIHTKTEVQNDQFFLHLGYGARANEQEVKLSWEHDKFVWLPKKEAMEVELPELHKSFLARYLELN